MLSGVIIVLCLAALVIAIWSATRPAPILWIATVLIAIAVMVMAADSLHGGIFK